MALLVAGLLAGVVAAAPAAAQIRWQNVPGAANDIAVATDGTAWVIGTNTVPGGFGIYKSSPKPWSPVPGGATRVAVEGTVPWVINDRGQIFRWSGSGWQSIAGPQAIDIGAGAKGVWIIAAPAVNGGYSIYKWDGRAWSKTTGGAVRVDVDAIGNPWVVNSAGQLFANTAGNWRLFGLAPGEQAADVSVDAFGKPWVVTKKGSLWYFDADAKPAAKWEKVNAEGSTLATAQRGVHLWHLNAKREILSWASSAQTPVAGGAGVAGITVGPLVSSTVQLATPTPSGTPRPDPRDPGKIFPRGDIWEARMLDTFSAEARRLVLLKPTPDMPWFLGPGPHPKLGNLPPLQQALGTLALKAAEIAYADNKTISAEAVITELWKDVDARRKVKATLSTLVVDRLVDMRYVTAPDVALRSWAAELFGITKLKVAKGMVDKFELFQRNPCAIRACTAESKSMLTVAFDSPSRSMATMSEIAMAAVKDHLALAPESIAVMTAGLAAYAAAGVGATVLAASLGPTAGGTASLFATFTGHTAGVAISGAGWAGLAAGPIAAATVVVVVSATEIAKLVEKNRVGPMLKAKLGAAMTQPVFIQNDLKDPQAQAFFHIAFQDSALQNFRLPPAPAVDGEVRFFCQAGYVCRFTLKYVANGRSETKTTAPLPVGQEQSFSIPARATNIVASGEWAAGVNAWRKLFERPIPRPTFTGFVSYGTIFNPQVKQGYPEIENIIAPPTQIVLTQGGGYVAWFKLEYMQNGAKKVVLNDSGVTLGRQFKFDIPTDATDIELRAWAKTGLAWEMWKPIIHRKYATAQGECIKVYSTTLDPKWNNECR